MAENATKVCKRCNQELPISRFSKSKKNKGGYNVKCTKCVYEHYYKDKRDLIRERQLYYRYKYLYGISKEDYQKLLRDCDNSCNICRSKLENLQGGLVIDHCHITNKLRGLLCQNCNRALGGFKDSPEILQKAIEYLNSSDPAGS